MSKAVNELLESAIKSLDGIIDTKKIIGEPITAPDGTLIIPVSQVSLGFGGGGSDFNSKNLSGEQNFGGGMGGGAKIIPQSFLVISNGNVRLISTEAGASPIDKIIDLVPEMVDKVNGFFAERRNKN